MMRRRKKDIAQEAEDVLCSLFARAEELEDPKSEEQNLIQEACEKPRVVSGEDELGFPKTSWDALVEDARSTYRSGHHAEGLLTEEELAAAGERVRILNEEYNALHRLDHVDIAISVSAGPSRRSSTSCSLAFRRGPRTG